MARASGIEGPESAVRVLFFNHPTQHLFAVSRLIFAFFSRLIEVASTIQGLFIPLSPQNSSALISERVAFTMTLSDTSSRPKLPIDSSGSKIVKMYATYRVEDTIQAKYMGYKPLTAARYASPSIPRRGLRLLTKIASLMMRSLLMVPSSSAIAL